MKIDLSCPIELWHFTMPTQAYPVVTLTLYNLSHKTVTSVQAAFVCFDSEGETLSRQVERVQGLTGDPHEMFEMAVAVEDGVQAARMDMTIEKVWFHDGTVWRRGVEAITEYEDVTIAPGKKLDTLKHVAGADAIGYPSDQGAVWVCICGRPNQASRTDCIRCGRDKHDVFTLYNKAAIEKIIFTQENEMEEKARQAREEAGRMAVEREKAELKARKRRRRIITSISTVVILAGGTYGVYFHGIPAYKYYRAQQQLEDGAYENAKAAFLELEDYHNSAEMVLESDYLRAGQAARTGNLTSLKAAQDIYETLKDYKDSADLAIDMRYQRAQLLMQAKEYENAIQVFGETPGYKDSGERITEAEYLWASQLMDALDYGAARSKFLVLGEYKDTAQLAQDCLYLPALSNIEQQQYGPAIELLKQLPDTHPDAARKIQEAHYLWGEMLFAQEKFDEAAEKYLAAGDYLDSYLKASACLYEPAVQMMAQGDYAGAKAKFDKISAYLDAAKLSQECSYQMGREALLGQDYAAAIQHFDGAPDVQDAVLLKKEASYLAAEAALAGGEVDQAIALFTQADDYKDAADRLNGVRYDQGIEAANSGDHERAMEIFAALGNYRNSEEELKRATYERAIALIGQGTYAEAVTALEGLGAYADSATYLKQARYGQAKADMDAFDFAAAAAAFEELGDYEDAYDQYREATYQQALEALNGEDLLTATQLLSKLPGYKNVDELYAGSVYKLGEALLQEGRLGEAAEQWALIPGYQDADHLAETALDAYYADAYAAAKEAMASKDYKTVVDALHNLDRANAVGKYSDIQQMYEQANYAYAGELYNKDKPYEALPYYRNIPDYRDVSTRRLTRVPYRIMGEWESTKGVKMVFNEDGTCVMDGRKLYYLAKNYLLQVGARPDHFDESYSIVRFPEDGKTLTLQNRATKTYYRMDRVQ